MAIYSKRFQTRTGDKLDFSVETIQKVQDGHPCGVDYVNLTIFKGKEKRLKSINFTTGSTQLHTRRRRVFGCTLSLTEWRRLREWLSEIGG